MSGNSVFYSVEEFFAATSINNFGIGAASLPLPEPEGAGRSEETCRERDGSAGGDTKSGGAPAEEAESGPDRLPSPGASAEDNSGKEAMPGNGSAAQSEAAAEKAANADFSADQRKAVAAAEETFSLIRPDVLCVNLDGTVWMRPAAMTGNLGEIRFARDPGLLNESIYTFLYKAFIGENSFLSVAHGKGRIFFTVGSHNIMLIHLNNESISIQGYNVIAFEDKLEHYVHMMGNVAGIAAGGLFFVTLSGCGWAAISVCGSPFTVSVESNKPLSSVPIRTLAWESHIKPEIKTDVTRINLMGRGVVDTLQMVFEGEGRVALHGNEEYMFPKIK